MLNELTIGNGKVIRSNMNKFDWEFFMIAYPSKTAFVNVYFESDYHLSLSVFLSDTMAIHWTPSKTAVVPPSEDVSISKTINKTQGNSWVYTAIGTDNFIHYLAVYGSDCPLKCKYQATAFLTGMNKSFHSLIVVDDSAIEMNDDIHVVTRTFTNLKADSFHYTPKINLAKMSVGINAQKIFSTQITLSSPTDHTNITTYAKAGNFPSTSLYDMKVLFAKRIHLRFIGRELQSHWKYTSHSKRTKFDYSMVFWFHFQ